MAHQIRKAGWWMPRHQEGGLVDAAPSGRRAGGCRAIRKAGWWVPRHQEGGLVDAAPDLGEGLLPAGVVACDVRAFPIHPRDQSHLPAPTRLRRECPIHVVLCA
jgi:hypothetical protein